MKKKTTTFPPPSCPQSARNHPDSGGGGPRAWHRPGPGARCSALSLLPAPGGCWWLGALGRGLPCVPPPRVHPCTILHPPGSAAGAGKASEKRGAEPCRGLPAVSPCAHLPGAVTPSAHTPAPRAQGCFHPPLFATSPPRSPSPLSQHPPRRARCTHPAPAAALHQPLRRAPTLHPADAPCTPCTQLPALQQLLHPLHPAASPVARCPAVPRVPSVSPS